jgi:LysM repeat protein
MKNKMKKLICCTVLTSLIFSSHSSVFGATKNEVADSIIYTGTKYVGAPYLLGSEPGNTNSFDCSSFSQYIFGQHDVFLPRTSIEQFLSGEAISRDKLDKGDIVFFDTDFDGIVNHLGVYVGNGQMIHASPTVGIAIRTFVGNTYWEPRYVGARRILTDAVISKLNTEEKLPTYTVLAGDSLWLISQRTQTTILELMEWNQLSSTSILPGQQLKVRTLQQEKVVNPSSQVTEELDNRINQEVVGKTHRVASGDSLFLIAQRYGVSISKIKEWNHLATNMIMIGQVLKVEAPFIPHVVLSGESLWILSTKYNISIQAVITTNKLTSSQIQIGQTLKIPVGTNL